MHTQKRLFAVYGKGSCVARRCLCCVPRRVVLFVCVTVCVLHRRFNNFWGPPPPTPILEGVVGYPRCDVREPGSGVAVRVEVGWGDTLGNIF